MHKCANEKYIVEGNKMYTLFGNEYRVFNIIQCPICNFPLQPERSKREDIRIKLIQEAQEMGLYE